MAHSEPSNTLHERWVAKVTKLGEEDFERSRKKEEARRRDDDRRRRRMVKNDAVETHRRDLEAAEVDAARPRAIIAMEQTVESALLSSRIHRSSLEESYVSGHTPQHFTTSSAQNFMKRFETPDCDLRLSIIDTEHGMCLEFEGPAAASRYYPQGLMVSEVRPQDFNFDGSSTVPTSTAACKLYPREAIAFKWLDLTERFNQHLSIARHTSMSSPGVGELKMMRRIIDSSHTAEDLSTSEAEAGRSVCLYVKSFVQACKTYFDQVWKKAKPTTKKTAWFQEYQEAVSSLRPLQLWLDGEIASLSMVLKANSTSAVLGRIELSRAITARPKTGSHSRDPIEADRANSTKRRKTVASTADLDIQRRVISKFQHTQDVS